MDDGNETLTVIIVAWNSRDEVEQCLGSLNGLARLPVKLETIVVDNASDDGTTDFLRTSTSSMGRIGLKVLYNSENKGLSRATQQAYKEASGKWVLLCNPDIIFNQSLEKMLSYAFSHPNQILTPELVSMDGRIHRHSQRFPTTARVFFHLATVGEYLDRVLMGGLVWSDYCPRVDNSYNRPVHVDMPGASLLLMSRDVIEKVGGIFHDGFPVWWGDVDLAKRAETVAIPRVLLTEVKIAHRRSYSQRKLPGHTARYLFCRSMIHYARKWKLHPRLLRFLFLVDAVLAIPLFVFLRKGSPQRLLWLKKDILYSAFQVSGVLAT